MLELALDREATGPNLNNALKDENGELQQRTERRQQQQTERRQQQQKATIKLQQLTRLLVKITSKEMPEIELTVKRIVTTSRKIPAVTIEKIK